MRPGREPGEGRLASDVPDRRNELHMVAELSLGAVQAFRDDAVAAGLTLDVPGKAHAAE
jgi:hypothetical protein